MLASLLYRSRLFMLPLLVVSSLHADTWKILFYMDSSEDLSDMAIKNITDMVRGKPNDTIEFLIQLHAYRETGLRYRVTNQGLIFLQEISISGNSKKDLIDAATWAFTNNAADHTMLIFSNHGFGILDPKFNPKTDQWENEVDQLGTSCDIKRSLGAEHARHKGFMFNGQAKTYLNNKDLINSLNYIKTNVLNEKLFDIIAFDTCMGAMLEVGYQLASFTRCLVGSQSCSLPDGFEYQGVMAALNETTNTPRAVATGMVRAFEAYYSAHDTSGVYTHAALDLGHVQQATHALDTVVSLLIALPHCKTLLSAVRTVSPRFCLFPMYTDVVGFCKIADAHVALSYDADTAYAVHTAVATFQEAVKKMVIARCGGSKNTDIAHGCAIYCPYSHIDSSYHTTLFAYDCQWIELLKKICDTQSTTA